MRTHSICSLLLKMIFNLVDLKIFRLIINFFFLLWYGHTFIIWQKLSSFIKCIRVYLLTFLSFIIVMLILLDVIRSNSRIIRSNALMMLRVLFYFWRKVFKRTSEIHMTNVKRILICVILLINIIVFDTIFLKLINLIHLILILN